jgi:hypothetical protein
MKIYKVHYRDKTFESKGFEFFAYKSNAEKANKKANKENESEQEVEEINFEFTKDGILGLLAKVACHPDNG